MRQYCTSTQAGTKRSATTQKVLAGPIPLNYQIGHFLLPFFLPRFSLGREREQGGVESQASVCFMGGTHALW
jgi:hypothetical protein